MKKWLFLTLFALLLAGGAGLVIGSEGEDGGAWTERWRQARLDVAPADDPKYAGECGACHFAYQPGLLPARSWQRLMNNLANHFGENAELAPGDVAALTRYLLANSADASPYKRSAGIVASLGKSEAPMRFTQTRYFQRKHSEVPRAAVQDNPQVGSFSKCEACHTQAAKGSYSEGEVRIPGFAQWDD